MDVAGATNPCPCPAGPNLSLSLPLALTLSLAPPLPLPRRDSKVGCLDDANGSFILAKGSAQSLGIEKGGVQLTLTLTLSLT